MYMNLPRVYMNANHAFLTISLQPDSLSNR
jgi:hypothetical protein